MRLDAAATTAAVSRLRRAEGQTGGVIRMLEEGRDSMEVVTQLAAVSRPLDKAGLSVVASGLKQCLSGPDPELDTTALERLSLPSPDADQRKRRRCPPS